MIIFMDNTLSIMVVVIKSLNFQFKKKSNFKTI